ncbi:MAG: phosphatase, partial [Epulopiscium sp.]|nr:phosphatase [Candidatus Epulonipiscium sp.]
IEDSANGVEGAKKAGMKCIGFQSPSTPKQDLSKADYIVSSMKEITVEMLQ